MKFTKKKGGGGGRFRLKDATLRRMRSSQDKSPPGSSSLKVVLSEVPIASAKVDVLGGTVSTSGHGGNVDASDENAPPAAAPSAPIDAPEVAAAAPNAPLIAQEAESCSKVVEENQEAAAAEAVEISLSEVAVEAPETNKDEDAADDSCVSAIEINQKGDILADGELVLSTSPAVSDDKGVSTDIKRTVMMKKKKKNMSKTVAPTKKGKPSIINPPREKKPSEEVPTVEKETNRQSDAQSTASKVQAASAKSIAPRNSPTKSKTRVVKGGKPIMKPFSPKTARMFSRTPVQPKPSARATTVAAAPASAENGTKPKKQVSMKVDVEPSEKKPGKKKYVPLAQRKTTASSFNEATSPRSVSTAKVDNRTLTPSDKSRIPKKKVWDGDVDTDDDTDVKSSRTYGTYGTYGTYETAWYTRRNDFSVNLLPELDILKCGGFEGASKSLSMGANAFFRAIEGTDTLDDDVLIDDDSIFGAVEYGSTSDDESRTTGGSRHSRYNRGISRRSTRKGRKMRAQSKSYAEDISEASSSESPDPLPPRPETKGNSMIFSFFKKSLRSNRKGAHGGGETDTLHEEESDVDYSVETLPLDENSAAASSTIECFGQSRPTGKRMRKKTAIPGSSESTSSSGSPMRLHVARPKSKKIRKSRANSPSENIPSRSTKQERPAGISSSDRRSPTLSKSLRSASPFGFAPSDRNPNSPKPPQAPPSVNAEENSTMNASASAVSRSSNVLRSASPFRIVGSVRPSKSSKRVPQSDKSALSHPDEKNSAIVMNTSASIVSRTSNALRSASPFEIPASRAHKPPRVPNSIAPNKEADENVNENASVTSRTSNDLRASPFKHATSYRPSNTNKPCKEIETNARHVDYDDDVSDLASGVTGILDGRPSQAAGANIHKPPTSAESFDVSVLMKELEGKKIDTAELLRKIEMELEGVN